MDADVPIHIDDVRSERWEIGEIAASRRRLALACGARRLGVALIDVDPGMRATPPHSHADEDEAFLVLAGSGLSYQTSGSKDVRTYAIGVDDLLWHPSGGDAHTLIAGEHGLSVLVVAEGSRTHITYLPRARQFWLGPRWTPADTRNPFVADAELGPLELPEPTPERPSTLRNLSELPLNSGREGRIAYATRSLYDMGARELALAQDEMPPHTHNTELHYHSAREEAWFVRGGSGVARIGEQAHPLRTGSFWLCRENVPVGHRVEVGEEGMTLVTMGDLISGDVCVYPEKRTFRPARGVETPY
ncbi:MAG TPA: hypothetical protein VGN25_02495 [Solirubrobacteraceae bacterium]|jgi:uncharacterized cupin superfamily protein|nr:hypothetical protein [Solirubrobacteraceae bacterium]